MWLRNYDILKLSACMPMGKLDTTGLGESQRLWYKGVDGTKYWMDSAITGITNSYSSTLNRNWSTKYCTNLTDLQITIDIGTGTSAPNYGDYGLEAPLDTTKIAKTLITVGKPKLNLDTHKWTVQVSLDFKNISGSEIVVTEWGIFTHANAGSSTCIYRDVLGSDKQVTVAANAYCRIDFEYDVDLPSTMYSYYGDTLADTWEQIVANVNNGTVDAYKVGDTKTLEFTYEGKIYYVQAVILGKNHDTISGTETKAALSWGFLNSVMQHSMNDPSTSVDGWMGENGDFYESSLDETDGVLTHGCSMRKFVAGLLNCFPTIIKDNIKTVDKLYDDSNQIQKCKDKLWILSNSELGFTSGSSTAKGQGEQYEYLHSGMSRRRDNGGSYVEYWTRSRFDYNFTSVTSAGGSSWKQAEENSDVVLGFCI